MTRKKGKPVTPDWSLANCRNTDPEVWFPRNGNFNSVVLLLNRICRECEIQPECNTWAWETNQIGFWGGEYLAETRSVWFYDDEDEPVD